MSVVSMQEIHSMIPLLLSVSCQLGGNLKEQKAGISDQGVVRTVFQNIK